MAAIFLKIFNLSITASWLVLVIIALRFLLKKAPKSIRVLMWALVAVRLICPVSLESALSLVPSTETIPEDIAYTQKPYIHSGSSFVNSTVNPILEEALTSEVAKSGNLMQSVIQIGSIIWLVGVITMLLYTTISFYLIHRKVREAVPHQGNIWLCDHIDTPFILGIIRPCIYLPSNMSERDMEYVVAHERAHLKRHDHWWKPLGFFLLTIHWFNPILWIAYILLCRDIELACDEKVIKDMGTEIKKSYSHTLISCSVNRRSIAACPLAFGEAGVKARVKSVLHYKKPTFWIVAVACIACIVVAICFLTNPSGDSNDKQENSGDIQMDENTERLKRKYPQYFDLPTENGLVVYVWQMSKDSYSCGLLPGKDMTYAYEDLWDLHTSPATIDEMKVIITSYRIPQSEVAICPISMPHSSYLYTIDDAYRANLEKMFETEISNIRSSEYSPIIDKATFDIDNDGKDEECFLTYGPTSGLFTFAFHVSENGNMEYFNIFTSPSMELWFEENAEGKVMLYGKSDENIRYMGIYVDGTNVTISSDEQDISYWGEQGLDSPHFN